MFCLVQEMQQIPCLHNSVNLIAVREEQCLFRSYYTRCYSKVARLLAEPDTNMTEIEQDKVLLLQARLWSRGWVEV